MEHQHRKGTLVYIIHTLYRLHVSATHVAIFREMNIYGPFKTD